MIDYEVDIQMTCDKCGKTVYEGDCVVLHRKCAGSLDDPSSLPYCSPVPFRDKYTCLGTRRDFDWDGELPPFCPCCGRLIRV